jgi:transketolase
MFASHHHLNRLCAIIDYNKIQSLGNTNEVMNLEPLADKLKAFNCHVLNIDGHNHEEILNAFRKFEIQTEKPTVIIANTVKGKGVSYMENNLAWHYKSPNEEQYETAIKEIEK